MTIATLLGYVARRVDVIRPYLIRAHVVLLAGSGCLEQIALRTASDNAGIPTHPPRRQPQQPRRYVMLLGGCGFKMANVQIRALGDVVSATIIA